MKTFLIDARITLQVQAKDETEAHRKARKALSRKPALHHEIVTVEEKE